MPSEANADTAATKAEDTPVADPVEGKQKNPESNIKIKSLRLLTNPTWQDLLSFVISVGAFISFLSLIVLLAWDTLRATIYIEPISVPKSFAEEKGLTPNIVSQRLRDAIENVTMGGPSIIPPEARLAQSSGAGSQNIRINKNQSFDIDVFTVPEQLNISNPGDLPQIVIPGVGASLDSFATTLQNFLGIERRTTISGEFTIFGNRLDLVLRRNRLW